MTYLFSLTIGVDGSRPPDGINDRTSFLLIKQNEKKNHKSLAFEFDRKM